MKKNKVERCGYTVHISDPFINKLFKKYRKERRLSRVVTQLAYTGLKEILEDDLHFWEQQLEEAKHLIKRIETRPRR